MFDDGRAILNNASRLAAEDITYRTPSSTFQVQSRIGRKLFRVQNGSTSVAVFSRRFIFSLADIPALPTKRDTIVWRGRLYKLGCPDGGPPWRWHGNTHDTIAVYATDAGETTE